MTDLVKLRELEKAATLAPWTLTEPVRGVFMMEADAKLVEGLRNAAPALLTDAEECERMWESLRSSKGAVSALIEECGRAANKIAAMRARIEKLEKALRVFGNAAIGNFEGLHDATPLMGTGLYADKPTTFTVGDVRAAYTALSQDDK